MSLSQNARNVTAIPKSKVGFKYLARHNKSND